MWWYDRFCWWFMRRSHPSTWTMILHYMFLNFGWGWNRNKYPQWSAILMDYFIWLSKKNMVMFNVRCTSGQSIYHFSPFLFLPSFKNPGWVLLCRTICCLVCATKRGAWMCLMDFAYFISVAHWLVFMVAVFWYFLTCLFQGFECN